MKIFHKIISALFQPLLMPTYAIALLVNMEVFSILPSAWRWVAIAGTFFFSGLLPFVSILMMMRRGIVKDLFIQQKEERTVPYAFAFIAYLVWTVFMWRTLTMPVFIVIMGLGSALTIPVVMLINRNWKISAHMSSMGGFTASIIGVSYRMGTNPAWLIGCVFVLSALVALSRLELKAHTPAQVICGFTLGFVSVLLPTVIFL